MQVDVQDLGGIKRRVKITLDKDTVNQEVDNVISQAQKEVNVRGFRKGTAPPHVVRNQLGDLINAEATARLTAQGIRDFVRDFDENKVAGLPVVIEEDRPTIKKRYVGELNLDGTMSFSADFEIEPELEVSDYLSLKVSNKPDLDEWVSRALNDVCDQFAGVNPTEEPAAEGNQLTLEFSADGEVGTVVLDSSLDPKVYEGLIGKKAGDEFDFGDGQAGTIHSVDVKELPEPNDELAQMAGYESLDKLIDDLKLRSEADYAGPLKAQLVEELTEQLLVNNDFELPDAWLNNEIQLTAQRFGLKEMPTDEQQLNTLKALAERNVRRSFIFDKIYSAEESIHMSTDELYTLAQADAKRNNVDVETYLTYLKNNNSYESFVAFHEQMRVVDFLIKSAEVKEKEND